MFSNYVKVALRNIIRHKGHSFINIAGLAIGMACTILILLWVQEERSWDGFHQNIDNLHIVYQRQDYSKGDPLITGCTHGPLAGVLVNEFPEIKAASRFIPARGKLVRNGDNIYTEDGVVCVDQSFLHMFSFPLVQGDQESALNHPSSILITQEMSQKYFGDEEPLGKTITIDNALGFTVTGVLSDIPHNSQLTFDFVVPFSRTEDLIGVTFENWGQNWPYTLVLLEKGVSYKELEEKIAGVLAEHQTANPTLFMQPVKDRHLYTATGEPGFVIYLYLFSAVAFFVLMIACINFMNLATARSENRAREVGMRKVVGAHRMNIVYQFFGESFLSSVIAVILAMVLVEFFIPTFNQISGGELALDLVGNNSVILLVAGVALFTGLMSGTYPALYLSAFQPVSVLKGTLRRGRGRSIFRNVLVVTQFSMSTALIIGIIVVLNQMGFIRQADLGYDKDHLVYMVMRGDSIKRYPTIKNEFLNHADVLDVTATSRLPISEGNSTANVEWEGKTADQSVLINIVGVDHNYLEAMGMHLADGRTFLPREASGEGGPVEYILNEEAIRQMGMEDPIGKRFGGGGNFDAGPIVGVVKDFHFATFHEEIAPMLLMVSPEDTRNIIARISPENVTASISHMESTWEKINPDIPFASTFLDDRVDQLYGTEKRVEILGKYFAGLAVFIAAIGLFGLASYTAEQRRKEIGVRKVLGASVSGVVMMLLKQITRGVLAANLLAWPVAYYFLDSWLEDFAYRTSLGWRPFALAGVLVMLIAVTTVSYQAICAARANPVESLKYE